VPRQLRNRVRQRFGFVVAGNLDDEFHLLENRGRDGR